MRQMHPLQRAYRLGFLCAQMRARKQFRAASGRRSSHFCRPISLISRSATVNTWMLRWLSSSAQRIRTRCCIEFVPDTHGPALTVCKQSPQGGIRCAFMEPSVGDG